MSTDPSSIQRCSWCGTDPVYVHYHDTVWGVPEYDDQALFAKLILDGAQAGLSWITILRRQDHYYRVFDGLIPEIIAEYDEARIADILQDPGIIRNKSKVNAAVTNARAYMAMKEKGISFSKYLWDFVDGKPLQNNFTTMTGIPAATPISEQMSKSLIKNGFKFVGPTIIYAFMQAVGMVNDHMTDCFRHQEVQKIGK